MSTKTPPNDLLAVAIIIGMFALLPVACVKGLERQAHADYQKCLSWQADGYDIQCDESKYK